MKDIGLSPAQIIYARHIPDYIPVTPGNFKPRPEWILTQEEREKLLARRYELMENRLKVGTKVLHKLEVGNILAIQNQTSPRAKKWDKTGVVVEILPFDQYRVKVDGSGQVTLRNQRFLRRLGQGGNIEDAPTQPVDTLDQVGAERGKRDTEYNDTASADTRHEATYSDVVRRGCQ